MRTLENALSDHDLITLRVIGEWWELDLTGADKEACVEALSERLQQLDFELELNYLPPEESSVLHALVREGGRMPVAAFSRHHGEVRQMGPGRLEREEPWLEPASPAEALWYRGFLFRGFDNAGDDGGLVEFYYLPKEFLEQFPEPERAPDADVEAASSLDPAQPPAAYEEATGHAVDDLTTLLAFAQRDGLQRGQLSAVRPYMYAGDEARSDLLLTLAEELELLRAHEGSLRPARAAVGWLQEDRVSQLRSLAEAWSGSSWNDLCHTPGLRCEGSGWSNEPVPPRATLLEALPRDRSWYQLADLVALIKETTPDFQRPEGNYDTWYIRDVEQDVYVRGFENWDLVEGRLLRFLLSGPMAWLGLTEVGDGRYRLTEAALQWLDGAPLQGTDVQVPLVVQPDATLLVPFNASRYQRFQAARVAEPQPLDPSEPYQYRLTPDSLSRAQESGIRPERVLEFLEEASGRPIPASVRRAVERWSERGLEGRLQHAVILRVRDSSILDTLQSNPKTRPYIGERLGDLAAVVRGQQWQELQQITAQLGLLLDVTDE
ncbi:MAG: helicase-associated domain-containing protein [Chloroflexota bacterium]